MTEIKNYNTITLEIDNRVARVTLNRPDVHNALNDILIDELFDAFTLLQTNDEVRVIVLTGNGKSFCAGADLNWMKSVVNYSYEQNYQESLRLAKVLLLIFTHSKPVIARINGSAIGGGVGMMSVCDILISVDTASFGLSEVKLGLVPAAISPFVMSRIGQAQSRELFITGERINATKACDIGLLNRVVSADELDNAVQEKIDMILGNGPMAVKTVKDMIFKVTQSFYPELTEYTAKLIADLRMSPEAQEGMNAFLEKRKPNWIKS